MKIEIVPEGNKTRKTGDDGILMSFLDGLLNGVGSVVEGLFGSLVEAFEAAMSGTIRRVIATVFGAIGGFFLFSGLATLIDHFYGVPGLGGIVVGVLVCLVALVIAMTAGRARR